MYIMLHAVLLSAVLVVSGVLLFPSMCYPLRAVAPFVSDILLCSPHVFLCILAGLRSLTKFALDSSQCEALCAAKRRTRPRITHTLSVLLTIFRIHLFFVLFLYIPW